MKIEVIDVKKSINESGFAKAEPTVSYTIITQINGIYSFETRNYDGEMNEKRVISHLIDKIVNNDLKLKKAFDVLEYEEAECIMPICEDDLLEGIESDIRELIGHDKGFEGTTLLKSFIYERWDEKLFEIAIHESEDSLSDFMELHELDEEEKEIFLNLFNNRLLEDYGDTTREKDIQDLIKYTEIIRNPSDRVIESSYSKKLSDDCYMYFM